MSEPTGEVLAFPQAPDGVEVRHLRAFVAVAEDLNFSRAAERLYLSQPALSRQIRALERLVGCELLRRSTHRVELTVAGSALLDRARRLLGDLDEAIATTQSVGGELANRMAAMWAPVLEVSSAGRDVQDMRTAYETFLAQAEVPEGVRVRPVNAGGVSSLALGPAGAAGDRRSSFCTAAATPSAPRTATGRWSARCRRRRGGRAGARLPARARASVPGGARGRAERVPLAGRAARRRRIVLAGDSVGGGLACSLLLALRAQELPLPAGAVLLCPSVDLSSESILSAAPRHRSGAARHAQPQRRGVPGRAPDRRPHREPAARRPRGAAAAARPGRDRRSRPAGVATARRPRDGPRRRRAARALPRRDACLPRLLVVPPRGRRRAPAGRQLHPRAARGRAGGAAPAMRPPGRSAQLRLRGGDDSARSWCGRPPPPPESWSCSSTPARRERRLTASTSAESISETLGVVSLSVACGGLEDGATAIEWTADHAAQLGADGARLLLAGLHAGAAVAAALAIQARDNGWPDVARQVLIHPRFGSTAPRGGRRGAGDRRRRRQPCLRRPAPPGRSPRGRARPPRPVPPAGATTRSADRLLRRITHSLME